MLSKRSLWLTYGCAILYALLGIILFSAPESMSTRFAWKVSPFVTMTIGGWCIGTAWSALNSARNWNWQENHCSLTYLWVFGLLETMVLINFRDKISLEHPVAWLYLLALGLTVITGLSGVADLTRKRLTWRDTSEPPFSNTYMFLSILFILIVVFLGIYGLVVPMGERGTNGEIFPEIMSAFTLRSFGAFYLSIALASTLLWISRSKRALIQYSIASYGLLIFITIAAIAYAGLFDLNEHPFGLIYWIAYIGVGIVIGRILLNNRKNVKIW